MNDDSSNRLTPGAFEARALSEPISAALRLHDAALVMKGRIDVPKVFEESILYDACLSVIWMAQKYLKANGVMPPVWLAEPGEAGFVDWPQAPR